MGQLGAGADAVGEVQDWGVGQTEAAMPMPASGSTAWHRPQGVHCVPPEVRDPPPTTITVLGTDTPAQSLWPQ